MIRTSIQGVWARKRRLAGTFLAVFLGVAFLSGTLALGDTLGANFETLFSSVTKGTDAVVHETNIMHNVSFYYRPSPHIYGPYYDYAYRPFWKYRIPPVYYRCGCRV